MTNDADGMPTTQAPVLRSHRWTATAEKPPADRLGGPPAADALPQIAWTLSSADVHSAWIDGAYNDCTAAAVQ